MKVHITRNKKRVNNGRPILVYDWGIGNLRPEEVDRLAKIIHDKVREIVGWGMSLIVMPHRESNKSELYYISPNHPKKVIDYVPPAETGEYHYDIAGYRIFDNVVLNGNNEDIFSGMKYYPELDDIKKEIKRLADIQPKQIDLPWYKRIFR